MTNMTTRTQLGTTRVRTSKRFLKTVFFATVLLAITLPHGAHADTQVLGVGTGRLVGVASFTQPMAPYDHAISAEIDGTIRDVYLDSLGYPRNFVLTRYGVRPTAVGAFYTPDDGFRHAIVALPDGSVHEIFFNNSYGRGDALLKRFSQGVVSVAGFYSANDRHRHVIVGLADGTVHDIDFHPSVGIKDTILKVYRAGTIAKVGGFYTADDTFLHAIVGLTSGTVREIFYRPGGGKGEATIAKYGQGITSLSATSVPGYTATWSNYPESVELRLVWVALEDRSLRAIVFNPIYGSTHMNVATMPTQIVGAGPDLSVLWKCGAWKPQFIGTTDGSIQYTDLDWYGSNCLFPPF